MKKSSFSVFCGVALFAGAVSSALAADVTSYLLVKGATFSQTNAGNPVLATGKPFEFFARAESSSENPNEGLTNASVLVPGKGSKPLATDGFELSQTFLTRAGMDATFPHGTYKFTFKTQNDGTKSPSLWLGSNAFPAAPKIANWADAQVLDARLPFTFTWNKLAGGLARDFVQLSIESTNTHDDVFSTPHILETGALNGTNISVTVPANTLADNQTYIARLLFAKPTYNTTAYAGSTGISGYYSETTFRIKTLPAPPAEGRISFKSRTFSVNESNGPGVITLIRNATELPTSVTVATGGGTAIAGTDYIGFSETVNFPTAVSEATVNVPVYDDLLLEPTETVGLYLTNLNANAVAGTVSNTSLLILDNEKSTSGLFQFTAASYGVSEGAGVVNLAIRRTNGLAGTISIGYETVAGSAQAGTDFIATNGVVVFSPGQTNKFISIRLVNDALYELAENFQVRLKTLTGNSAFGPRHTATVGIANDDAGGVIAFRTNNYSVFENATNGLISVVRTSGKAAGVTVDYIVEAGTATAGQDFTAVQGTLTFNANETNKTIQIPIINDLIADVNETISIRLTNATGGASLGAFKTGTVKIVDDESSFTFASATASGTEGGAVTFTINRAGSLKTAASVRVTTTALTATAGSDYTTVNTVISFPINTPSKTVSVPLILDPNNDGNETLRITLSEPTGGAQLGGITMATGTILNKPDPNAVPAAGGSFMKFTVTPITTGAPSKSMDITHNPSKQEIIAGSYSTTLNRAMGLNGSKISVSQSGGYPNITVNTINHFLQFTYINVAAPGVIPVGDSTGSQVGVLWSYTESTMRLGSTTPSSSISHNYGSGQTGVTGTVTIDVLDKPGKTITGRFNFVGVDTKSPHTKKVRITGSFRIKNVSVN